MPEERDETKKLSALAQLVEVEDWKFDPKKPWALYRLVDGEYRQFASVWEDVDDVPRKLFAGRTELMSLAPMMANELAAVYHELASMKRVLKDKEKQLEKLHKQLRGPAKNGKGGPK